MNPSESNPSDPQAMIDRYLDGEISVEDAACFERLLADDPEYRRQFVRQSFMHRQVRDLTAAAALDAIDHATAPVDPVGSITPAPTPTLSERGQWRTAAGFAIAGVAVAIWIVIAGQFKTAPPDPGQRQPLKPMAGLLMAAHGVQWTSMPTDLPPSGGTGLPIGEPLAFSSGVIEIEFYSGVRATIEGPASFRLDSPMKMVMGAGRLSAAVPEGAQGFTVVTDRMNVVDLGTEFGVLTGWGGDDEVHVFKGAVKMTAGTTTHELNTGGGSTVTRDGIVRSIAADSIAFLRPEPFDPPEYLRWIEYRNRLRVDPALVLYYTFQGQEPGDTVADDQSGRGHYATMTEVAIEDGRIPGKPAVRFTGEESRVRFRIPGEFESLTAIMWVNIDKLPHRFNSLLHTDGWEQSEPHWIVGDQGDLYFNIRDVLFQTTETKVPDVDPASTIGAWRMMVGVFDRDTGRVAFYIDGQQVFDVPTESDLPLVFDWTEIGNWRSVKHGGQRRWLNGRIDEFALLERAMSDEEIKALYQMGKTETQP